MINILFTSVGRRVELLKAFRQAYHTLGIKGKIVATDIDPLAPALQVANQVYVVPRVDHPDYIKTVVKICKKEKITLLFPLIDPDIPILARGRKQIESSGAKLAVVDEKAAAIGADKWQTYHFFQLHGLPTPRTWLPDQLDRQQVSFPLFIKPRKGSAAQGAFSVYNKTELNFFTEYISNPIIQEYLPGPEITSDVICDLEGNILGVVSRQRIEVRWGEVAKGVTVYDPEIINGCVKIASALPATGPITVQCMLKDKKVFFTEFNARLGGGAPLAVAAGADFPQWLLARAAGVPHEVPPLGSYTIGLNMTRYDDSFFLKENEIERFKSSHI